MVIPLSHSSPTYLQIVLYGKNNCNNEKESLRNDQTNFDWKKLSIVHPLPSGLKINFMAKCI